VSYEARRISVDNLPKDFTEQDMLRREEEIRCREDLRRYLTRVQRSKRRRNRYKEMKKAGIDLGGLEQYAEIILDDPITATTSSTASSPERQQNHRYPHQPNPPARGRSRSQQSWAVPVFPRDNEHGHPPRCPQRPEGDPSSEHAMMEHRRPDVIQNSRPPLSYDPDNERAGHQIPRQRRSSSASYDSGFVDQSPRLQRPHEITNSQLPLSYDPDNERARHQIPKQRRSSSASYDSGFVDQSPRLRRTTQVITRRHPPLSNDPDNERAWHQIPRQRRSSSASYDLGFVDQSPRLQRPHEITNSQLPLSYDPDNERAWHQIPRQRRSSSASYDLGFADRSPRLRRTTQVITRRHPPLSNDPDQERRGRRQRRSRSRSSSFGHDSGAYMTNNCVGNRSTRR